MLPDVGNFDDLIVDYTEQAREKTQTFRVNRLTVPVNPYEIAMLNNTELGVSVVGATSLYNIGGKIDGLAALQQSLALMLSIEADQHIIYPYTYGVNTLDLIGKPSYYVVAILPERLKETLMSDDRVLDVTDFEFEVIKNKVHVKFVVHTIYGNLDEETVVNY